MIRMAARRRRQCSKTEEGREAPAKMAVHRHIQGSGGRSEGENTRARVWPQRRRALHRVDP